eukprot:scaffold4979_cov73-Cylindrotheca_fusiformis.AAC.4
MRQIQKHSAIYIENSPKQFGDLHCNLFIRSHSYNSVVLSSLASIHSHGKFELGQRLLCLGQATVSSCPLFQASIHMATDRDYYVLDSSD